MEVQDLLSKLKCDCVLQRFGENNIICFEILWSYGGINVFDRLYEKYLNNFCYKFWLDVQRLIDKSLEYIVKEKVKESSMYKEVFYYFWFC